ncbi:MAG TPA: HEAT repeat domain-containing protein [Pyrinomonadaceae bacterium]|nr:HEAT repeat domain-containing protein [Pyrinomonadaceae bacterium]
MTGNGEQFASDERVGVARRRTPWGLAVVAALFVIVPFLYWYGTWFGRELSDEQIEEYLTKDDNPRHAQHALSQIAQRIEERRPGAERWNQRVVALAESPVTDLRMTAAWVMGAEHTSEEFRAALLKLLTDAEPVVRRNAALALVRFGDARARPELLAMLRPYSVKSPATGKALTVLTVGAEVNRESMLARIERADGGVAEVRSPLPGKIEAASVREGDRVEEGGELFVLATESEHARDALIGLYYFGEAEDLPEIERFAGGVAGMSEEVKRQAALTAAAVTRRAAAKD